MDAQAPRPIRLGLPGEDIDPRDLAAVVRRFRNLHRVQLQRIQDCQTARQRDFLDLLPLLFHGNYASLPGFVSLDAPAGIPDYQPSRAALRSAAKFSRSYEFKSRALPAYPIHALYLMGSVGSIAYSRKSDLDIWLCHDSNLDEAALTELHRKAQAVERWATSLGLEAHIFFIDSEKFRQGHGLPISTESCGSVQPHLLLEEFYRTGLWLAGRVPGWWLVPPEQENHYSAYLHHLQVNRFVDANELVDFGGLEQVRPDEFLGGTFWHLHKAIAAPHKSLLKLFLMESYAAEYPNIEWLCTQVKAAVYDGRMDVDALDSYLLMYRRVERYLMRRGETSRLELARQCFYLKINGLLTDAGAPMREKTRRREILDAMIQDWQWSSVRVRDLEQRRRWRIVAALDEQKAIGQELTLNYRGMRQFAQEHAGNESLPAQEIRLLGRRLSAALERKPGKVEILNLDSGDRLAPEDFSLHEVRLADGDLGWVLSTGRSKLVGNDRPILKKTRSLLEILTWLVLNGLYRPGMGLFLETLDSGLTPVELRHSLDALAGWLKSQPPPSDTLADYAQPPRVVAVAWFVNLGVNSEAARRDGLLLASNRYDALSYGYERVNLVERVDALVLTSWQETLIQSHQGPTAVCDCLLDVMNDAADPPPRHACFCFASARARTITIRIERLYRSLSAAFGTPGPMRYLVLGGTGFWLFERHGLGVDYREVADEDRLYTELAAPRDDYAPLGLDPPAALALGPLAAIQRQSRPGVIQVFCLPESQQVRLYILDERGSLFYRLHEPLGPQLVLGPYAAFLGAVLQRYVLAAGGIEYYLVERDSTGDYAVRPAGFRPDGGGKRLDLRVYAQDIAPGRVAYTLVCDDWEFSSMDAGQDVFAAAAERITHLRQSGDRYPIYITDLDVPLAMLGVETPEQLQTIHCLHYKRKIEQRLNPE